METWCSDWFGGSYLIFEGVSGEWFLFSFVGILVLCHKTHGEAQISSCGSQKSDSDSRGVWSLSGFGHLAPAAVSDTKAQDKADHAFTVQGPSKAVYTEGDGQIFSCKLSSIPNGKFHLNLL